MVITIFHTTERNQRNHTFREREIVRALGDKPGQDPALDRQNGFAQLCILLHHLDVPVVRLFAPEMEEITEKVRDQQKRLLEMRRAPERRRCWSCGRFAQSGRPRRRRASSGRDAGTSSWAPSSDRSTAGTRLARARSTSITARRGRSPTRTRRSTASVRSFGRCAGAKARPPRVFARGGRALERHGARDHLWRQPGLRPQSDQPTDARARATRADHRRGARHAGRRQHRLYLHAHPVKGTTLSRQATPSTTLAARRWSESSLRTPLGTFSLPTAA